jgi:two-component system sensor histidine kinase RstB
MRSIFFRIYMGMLVAIVIIFLLITVGTYYVSKYRITEHVYKNYSGTFKLIGEGVARHQGQKQAQWLGAIERLSDLKFEQHNLIDSPISNNKLLQLKSNTFYFHVDPLLSTSEVLILMPDQQGYLAVKLSDFGSSLVRLSAFLMLNELGRHKTSERIVALENLRSMFDYAIGLRTLESLNISSTNLRSVKKGDIAVVLKNSATSTPSLSAYAPLGNSPYALVLGPIPFFDWFPLTIMIVLILCILVLMAGASFLLVRPLERRLQAVDQQIEGIGQDKDLSMSAPAGKDAIGKLSTTVNAMTIRIHKLIDAKNEMISAISHELRTPITRIRFRMISLEGLASQVAQDSVKGVERDLDQLETLIDEVLTFSKLIRDLPELNLQPILVSDFFDELISLAATSSTLVEIKTCMASDVYLQGDRRYLMRAIENILSNAQRYAHSSIQVGCQLKDGQQQIWVADDGAGIPVEQQQVIFEPFKRLDPSRDRHSGGYGLGLAIVQQIACWHQGKVEVAPSTSGGTKIVFSWPQISLEG